jgi:hypothetical protein
MSAFQQFEQAKHEISKARDAATVLRGERYLTGPGRRALNDVLEELAIVESLLRQAVEAQAVTDQERHAQQKRRAARRNVAELPY